ncbi:MAG: tyrosine-type recombinase/integrase [Gammaproteobacteria bacterium]|nr:tyrosine-type recombinase/integrase [Gammaproteobacteria bacterium]
MSEQKVNFTKSIIESLPTASKGKRLYFYDTKTRGLGISITPAGTKTFIVYRWVKGKPERITLGRFPDLTIEQARRMAMEANADIAKGDNPNDKRRLERAEMTFSAMFSEYLERYAKVHKKSWKADQDQFNRYLKDWGKRKLSNITKNDIQKLHQQVGREKGTYAANRLLALLSTIFNKAIEYGSWDKTNPALGIKKFKEKSRDRFLQADELPCFFQAVTEEPNIDIRDYVLLSLLTGARRSNVLSMRWEQINFQRAEWRIPETKNGEPQIITLSDEALNILTARKLTAKNQFVFPSNGMHGHITEPKKGWQRILARAGIENLRIHDLRRTLGSWQAKTGASLAIIGKSLNHKSPLTTAIYARLDLDPVRESVEKATKAMLEAAGIELNDN